MRTQVAATIASDGITPVRVEFYMEPADPDTGIPNESVVVTDVLLENGESVLDEHDGNMEWWDQFNKFITDPWYAEYDPYDPDMAYDSRAISPERECA